jgi:hypothetical protein
MSETLTGPGRPRHGGAGCRWRAVLESLAAGSMLALLVVGCGSPSTATGPAISTDGTPPNRSSGPQPTADSPPLGGAGGPGTGDAIGSGGGITGTGVP